MGTIDWVLTLILGGFLGMIGQGIRVVAGLKKVNDQASQRERPSAHFFRAVPLV